MENNFRKNLTEEEKALLRKKAENELRRFFIKYKSLWKKPAMILKDGVKMSVQASSYHYSTPAISGLEKYEAYEVGFPSEVIEQLKEYVEEPVETDEEYLKSVYPNVPHDALVDIIFEHGGIALETPQKSDNLKELKDEKARQQAQIKQAELLINELMAKLGNIFGDDKYGK